MKDDCGCGVESCGRLGVELPANESRKFKVALAMLVRVPVDQLYLTVFHVFVRDFETDVDGTISVRIDPDLGA